MKNKTTPADLLLAFVICLALAVYIQYFEYCGPASALFGLTYVLGNWLYNRPRTRLGTAYRDPDPASMARQRARERATRRRHFAWNFTCGFLIGAAVVVGFQLGHSPSFARDADVVTQPLPSGLSQLPAVSPHPSPPPLCQCEDMVIVLIDYDIVLADSPFGLMVKIVIRRILVFDTVLSVCR